MNSCGLTTFCILLDRTASTAAAADEAPAPPTTAPGVPPNAAPITPAAACVAAPAPVEAMFLISSAE